MKSWSFRVKMLALIVLMASVSLVISAISFTSVRSLVSDLNHIAKDSLPNLNNVNDMYLHFIDTRVDLRSLAIPELSPEQGKKIY